MSNFLKLIRWPSVREACSPKNCSNSQSNHFESSKKLQNNPDIKGYHLRVWLNLTVLYGRQLATCISAEARETKDQSSIRSQCRGKLVNSSHIKPFFFVCDG